MTPRIRKVLVCGGRHYTNGALVRSTLDDLHRNHGPIEILIHGGATCADMLADRWALVAQIPARVRVDADWSRFGRRAGPLRNKAMIEMRPDLVLAFPGGSGTADMVRRATAAGVRVVLVSEP